MRKNLAPIVALFLAILTPAMASTYQGIPKESIFKSSERRYGHLEYMGFYASAMQHWNFTGELAPFTNLTWIATSNRDLILDRLREAGEKGVGAVLSVQPLIFDAQYRLRPDYLNNLARLQQRIDAEGLTGNITMVYPIDEPYSHAAKLATNSREQMKESLLLVTRELKALFPGKPLGVIFSHGEVLRDDFSIPDSYDWIGFDCYYSLFDCDDRPQTDHYRKLLKRMTPEQSLMAVPQAWVRYADYKRKDYENDKLYEARQEKLVRRLRKRLLHHYEIALSEPRFIAFMPFLWSMEPAPGASENAGFGVERFEEMFPEGGSEFKSLIKSIGTQIVTASHRYPNLSRGQTESNLLRPSNDYDGRIMGVSGKGIVSAWGVNRALPHKSLRMQIAIYHENREVYVSKRRRSFILDDFEGPSGQRPNNPIGVHGYRVTLPDEIVSRLRGEPVVVELRVWGDRAKSANYHRERRQLSW
jgi:hypothetical protein